MNRQTDRVGPRANLSLSLDTSRLFKLKGRPSPDATVRLYDERQTTLSNTLPDTIIFPVPIFIADLDNRLNYSYIFYSCAI